MRAFALFAVLALAAPITLASTVDVRPATRSAGLRVPAAPVGDVLTAGSLLGTHGFGPVEVVNGQDFGGEPGIDVAPDGTVYVNAPIGIGGGTGSWAYRKEADGSWRRCGITSGPGGGDSNVAINPWGRIAMNDLWLGSLTFYQDERSRCAFWLSNPVSTPVPVGDRQWIDWGWADCEYFQSWNQIPTGIHVQHTKDCGLTWRDTQVSTAMDLIGNLVVDHSGATRNVYQFYGQGGAIKVAIIKTTANALGTTLTYTTRTIVGAVAGHNVADSFPVGDVDAAGNIHVIWQDLHSTGPGQSAQKDSYIRYAYSADGGSSWSAARTISDAGTTSAVFPWIAAGGAGKAIAAWYQADKPGDPNIVAGPWFVQTARVTSLGGAFTQERATPLSIHNDVICTGGSSCRGDDRDLLDFFEVDIDERGYAVIAFAKDTDAMGNGNGDPRNAFVRQTSGDPLL